MKILRKTWGWSLAADVIIELINDDGRIQLRCEKSKDSPPFETRRLRLVESGDSCVLIKANSLATTLEPLAGKPREVLAVLADPAFKESGMRLEELMSLSGLPSSTVYYSLPILKKWGYVIQPQSKGPYFITDKGHAVLSPIRPADMGVEIKDDEGSVYGEPSNGSKDSPMSPSGEMGKLPSSYSNLLQHPFRGWSRLE